MKILLLLLLGSMVLDAQGVPISGSVIYGGDSRSEIDHLLYANGDLLSAAGEVGAWQVPLVDGAANVFEAGAFRFELEAFVIGYEDELFLNASGEGWMLLDGFEKTYGTLSYSQTPNGAESWNGSVMYFTAVPQNVPEGGSSALLLGGAVLVACCGRKRLI